MENSRAKIHWITRTAVFIALLIVIQAATASLGNTIVTGSLVNLILVVSVMTCGLVSGLTVAVISPIAAKLLGIGPLWSLIPFIALGNAVLVIIWFWLGNKETASRTLSYLIALVTGAAAKFLVLYLGIVKIAVPLLLHLPTKQAATISGLFYLPQLITALIGGSLAMVILPPLKKALSHSSE